MSFLTYFKVFRSNFSVFGIYICDNNCYIYAGKYPHLMVACDGVTFNSPQLELVVNFGSVPVGQNPEKWIEIINLSPVR